MPQENLTATAQSHLPLVSIIIPAYNAEEYIAETILSVVVQTFTDWELFIIDDGSTDSTAEIVKPFLTDERIQYHHKANSGVSGTRNYGMKLAAGQFIALLDADDIWQPEKLERQLKVFGKYPEAGVCATELQTFSGSGHTYAYILTESDEYYEYASAPLVSCRLNMPLSSLLLRRDVYEKTGGFDEAITSLSEDWDFLLRASAYFPFVKIRDILVLYRTGHENATSKIGDMRRDTVLNYIVPKFQKEHSGLVKWHHVWRLYSDCYYGRAMSRKNWFAKTYWLLRSFVCCPFNRDTAANLIYQVISPLRSFTVIGYF